VTSISSQYWHIMLAQGICVGIGAGMAFMPSVAIVGTYFSTRRSTAMGITATGSSIGGIIYPIVLKRLIQDIGFRWAVRVMAFIMLGTLLISVAVMRPRLPPRKSGPLINWGNLVDPVFATWLAAVFLTLLCLYMPFFYVEQYALSIGADADLAFYMLIIMNAGSVPGRVLPGMVADKTGTLAIMIPAVLLSGVIMLAWISVKTQGSLIAASFFFGLTSGAVQAVLPSTVVFLRPNLSELGTNLGMTLFSAGIGLLVGAPVAGAILDHQSGESGVVFWGAFTFSGVAVILGGLLLCVVRVMKVGFTLAKA
jgi:MFS family permease